MIGLYCTCLSREKKMNLHWRNVQVKSDVWSKKNKQIESNIMRIYKNAPPELTMDLDPHATAYIIVDEGASHPGSYARAPPRALSSTLQCPTL